MSLDAQVCCDCLEQRQRAGTLPGDVSLKIYPDGMPVVICEGTEIWEDHPRWNEFACEHQSRALLHQWLGNISSVGMLRVELSRNADQFPLLLTKVIYNGCHAGDYLPMSDNVALRAELQGLRGFRCVGNKPTRWFTGLLWRLLRFPGSYYVTASQAQSLMEQFCQQMTELVETSERVGKPIVF